MRIKSLILAALCMATVGVYAQSNYPFNGLDMNMGNLSRLSDAKTRSISPENFTGEKGKGGMPIRSGTRISAMWPTLIMRPRTWARVGR